MLWLECLQAWACLQPTVQRRWRKLWVCQKMVVSAFRHGPVYTPQSSYKGATMDVLTWYQVKMHILKVLQIHQIYLEKKSNSTDIQQHVLRGYATQTGPCLKALSDIFWMYPQFVPVGTTLCAKDRTMPKGILAAAFAS